MAKEDNLTPFTSETGRQAGKKSSKLGSKHLSTHIQEMLNDENFELKLKDGSVLRERPITAIIKTAIAKSVSGDTRAMEWLAKHGYGEKLNLNLENPIELIIAKYGTKGGVSDLPKTQGDDDRSSSDTT